MNLKWSFKGDGAHGGSQPGAERIKRLAKSLDALARKDETHLQKAREIDSMRRQAAVELHGICADFVHRLNELLAEIDVEFQPDQYTQESFQEAGVNLFQINARGRILQINFEPTPELSSTEDFRVPYILSGAVRCFNRQLLEKDLIEEQLLFYTIEKSRRMWRFFDVRTYRSGPFDGECLAALLERLI